MVHKILILGGTTEARQLAHMIAGRRDIDCTLSLAGRTSSPVAQSVPVRVGGFGGADGLGDYLRQNTIDVLIDATHPFASVISANAAAAVNQTGVAHFAIRRAPWKRVDGDLWHEVDDISQAISYAGDRPRRIFAALGRQELQPLLRAPFHHYLIRSIEPVEPRLDLPHAQYILGRGPFAVTDEVELLKAHDINLVIAKNSGGEASYGKVAAARELAVKVCLIRQPELPDVPCVDGSTAALERIDHLRSSSADARGGADPSGLRNERGE